jgi:hypothetical protein
MIPPISNPRDQKTTSYLVVLPFYIYAGISFLTACSILAFSAGEFTGHYFAPHILSITHILSLGWGTMIILGACHQMVPVITGGRLYSNMLAYGSFVFAAVGIPLLACAFYTFNLGWCAQAGAILINSAIFLFLINIWLTIHQSKTNQVQGIFILTAVTWLFLTTLIGLLLVYNFTIPLLNMDSLKYLPLHAHIGIVGWFLLLIICVGSRLIPLFLISKYKNDKLLWTIYLCINTGLSAFIVNELFFDRPGARPVFVLMVFAGIACFAIYCFKAWEQRVRRNVDRQMKLTLISVAMMLVPIICLLIVIILSTSHTPAYNIILLYGFCIFLGWITAIIFGMTFKTLPFIVWNKVYHNKAKSAKTPSPKDIFNENIFKAMGLAYLGGYIIFGTGLALKSVLILQSGALCLVVSAILYVTNMMITVFHKAKMI